MKQFERYTNEVHRLKLAYQDRITLLVGLETEYITSVDLDSLEKLLGRFGEKIEYIVGSVHHVHGIPIDFDLATFQSCLESFHGGTEHDRMEEFLCAYFDAQYVVLERFRPEIVGHIDLCRLYNPHLPFSDYSRAEAKLERNIQFAVGYGALFEVNAAPFRKGWGTGYPGKDALQVGPSKGRHGLFLISFTQMIVKHGGKLCLSDDSHGKHAVGLNYDRLADYLRTSGITEIYHLVRCELGGGIGGRKTRAVLVEGDWRTDPFWD